MAGVAKEKRALDRGQARERPTGGETEVRPDKETPGALPADALERKKPRGAFVVPPAEWGKTSGSPSGGVAGGTPGEEIEEESRR